MGRWDEAIAIVREGVPAGELQVLGGLGRVLGEAARLAPAEDPALLGVRMAWEQEARAILETLLEGASRGEVTAYSVATVYAGLGEVDLTFEWLEKAFQEQSLIFEIMHPRYEELQRDPRFAALRARLGLQSR
jgi:hypothetical protein